MKSKSAKQQAAAPKEVRYPFIGFRPTSPLQEARIRKLADATGMSVSWVLQECITAHLPVLESHVSGKAAK